MSVPPAAHRFIGVGSKEMSALTPDGWPAAQDGAKRLGLRRCSGAFLERKEVQAVPKAAQQRAQSKTLARVHHRLRLSRSAT